MSSTNSNPGINSRTLFPFCFSENSRFSPLLTYSKFLVHYCEVMPPVFIPEFEPSSWEYAEHHQEYAVADMPARRFEEYLKKKIDGSYRLDLREISAFLYIAASQNKRVPSHLSITYEELTYMREEAGNVSGPRARGLAKRH